VIDQKLPGLAEHSSNEFATDGRELLEEIVNRPPTVEGIKERLDRNAGAGEARRAALDVGIGLDGGFIDHHRMIARRGAAVKRAE
jgi:hypothetical protein